MSEAKVYDVDETRALLREIAAEKPEGYVYPRAHGECLYREPDGSPSCIIGHLADRLDLPLPPEGTTVNGWQPGDFTPEAQELMFQVQIEQDGGVPWRDAVEVVRDEAR